MRDFGSVCFRCHASFIEVVVALSIGLEYTRIPYFSLNYLVGQLRIRNIKRSGLIHPRGPFLSSLGLTRSRGPFHHHRVLLLREAQNIKWLGHIHPKGPFLSSLGLTPSQGPFLSSSGLTPSRDRKSVV